MLLFSTRKSHAKLIEIYVCIIDLFAHIFNSKLFSLLFILYYIVSVKLARNFNQLEEFNIC